ncbi:MAG TPA: cytochrome C oxidase subunit IV family protein [Vicinamibacterales bacterium]|jgi:cytochrome c oxidase subunit 4
MSGHVSPKSTYYAIFGALMVLTIVTIAVAYQPLGSWNFPVAISIAITKATLVILFFMHAKYSSNLTKLFVGTAFFFLFIMLTLTMTDNLSRGFKTYQGGAAGAGYGQRDPSESAPAPKASEGAPAH